MKTFKWTFTAGLVIWGVNLLSAATLPSTPVRVSLVMPVQVVDFSDLDMRDENNQPIEAPQLRQRFEDALNANMNRLLIENLTPIRQAFLALVAQTRDAFAESLGRGIASAERLLWTVVDRGSRALAVLKFWLTRAAPAAARAVVSPATPFASLASLMISTTRLLR